MNQYIALIKRELWESRSFTWVPMVIAAFLLLITLMSLASGTYKGASLLEHFKHAEINIEIDGHDMASSIAGNIFNHISEEKMRMFVQGAFAGMAVVFYLPLLIVIIFYCLDGLYSERQDRSVFFWKSMPISDTETVFSKLLTGAIVAPLMTLAVIMIVQIIIMILLTPAVWVLDGSAWHVLWKPANPPIFWLSLLLGIALQAIWWAPVYGWCLLVSSWTKRSPIITATLPILALGFIELIVSKIFYGEASHIVYSIVIQRFSGGLIHWSGEFDDDTPIQLISAGRLGEYFTSSSVWLGLIASAIFIAGAIYFRRSKNEC